MVGDYSEQLREECGSYLGLLHNAKSELAASLSTLQETKEALTDANVKFGLVASWAQDAQSRALAAERLAQETVENEHRFYYELCYDLPKFIEIYCGHVRNQTCCKKMSQDACNIDLAMDSLCEAFKCLLEKLNDAPNSLWRGSAHWMHPHAEDVPPDPGEEHPPSEDEVSSDGSNTGTEDHENSLPSEAVLRDKLSRLLEARIRNCLVQKPSSTRGLDRIALNELVHMDPELNTRRIRRGLEELLHLDEGASDLLLPPLVFHKLVSPLYDTLSEKMVKELSLIHI